MDPVDRVEDFLGIGGDRHYGAKIAGITEEDVDLAKTFDCRVDIGLNRLCPADVGGKMENVGVSQFHGRRFEISGPQIDQHDFGTLGQE